ncbi:MAG: hypothetical protein ACE5K7_04730, partial [Phycisphaerae bacterium]
RACDSWRAALAGLGLSTAYLGLGGVEHGLALRLIADHARAAKQTVVQAGAYPQIGSVFVWRLVYRTDESFYVARLNSMRARLPRFAGAAIANDPFVRRAEEHPRVQLFRRFAMGMVRPVHRRLDGQDLVVYHDMRYGWPTDSLESMWTVQVWFDAAGRIAKVFRAAGPAAWARHVAPDHRSR